jgi:hypothetical protein
MIRVLAMGLGLALLSAAAAAAPAASPADAGSVTGDVLEAGLFDGVTRPSTFHYRYEMQAETMKAPFVSRAVMEVRKIAGDGSKEVYFDLFEGKNRRQLGPMAAQEVNPLILVFLQLDVDEMGNITGGAPLYFQRQIRDAFNAPAEEKDLEVEVGGRAVQARQIRMQPFLHDPHLDRFPAFRDKTYEFVVSKDVPGGLVSIAAVTPDPKTGAVVVEKSMTFESAE